MTVKPLSPNPARSQKVPTTEVLFLPLGQAQGSGLGILGGRPLSELLPAGAAYRFAAHFSSSLPLSMVEGPGWGPS